MTRTLIGSHGPTTRNRTTNRDEEVADFVAARQAALLRTAYLLTGDEEAAKELVSSSLAALYLSWRTVGAGGAELFVRRRMVTVFTSPWPLSARRATAGPVDGDDLWRRIQELPRRQRAMLVLCLYEGLSQTEAADLLDIGENAARTLLLEARTALGVHEAV